jgi:cobalt/nickel transport system ATP-binding protein
VAEPVFEVREVVFRYRSDVVALDGLSLSIERGSRVALLGANGSGKSTLLRVLDGLYFPRSGSVQAFGEPLTEERLQDDAFALAFRRRVTLVFQNPDVQLFNPTVFDEVAFGPLQLRWPKDEVRRRVAATLDAMEIAHLKGRSPHRLSGGEKKRVALASVLVLDPEVILFDEPTAGLDPWSQGQVIDLLVGWRQGPKTVVIATHELETVEEIADRCVVLDQGRVAAEGTPGQILADPDLLRRTRLTHTPRGRRDLDKPALDMP